MNAIPVLANGYLTVRNSWIGSRQMGPAAYGYLEFVSLYNSYYLLISLTNLIFPVAGSGKTVLASSIVDHVFALQQGSSSMNSISYFFCDFNNQQSRGTRTILGSLARQILHIFDETPEIDEKLKSMFVTNHREPTIEDLFALLECIARIPATAFLLIDGLDECGDSDRRQVLSFIKQVFRDRQCKIKVIVSSRWDLDISNALADFQQISLGSGTCSDIELFVRDIVDRRLADGSIETQNPAMAQEIKTALIEKSGGM